jgi:hypothetical protein
MNEISGGALASPSNQSPSVGLALVDSMTSRQIKAFDSHAQAFMDQARLRLYQRG